ncbi:helix-turn-helix domain-containing protein [Chromobacterium alticapitis]|uniref:AraC family transcriptional regulator n=1 Tax=Chromobacterium alticapitis TaxID=2073169 RepID=A0A2S5DJ92_9NEIS|nr:AraC family transcriptional regulator [Chromobacterium alticapitis]POZ63143.1 AraC family transcriptional regulator [Chromobacterium alticapitis]
MPAPSAERSDLFRADDLGRLECLDAHYAERVFPPHFHEEYVVNTLTLGAQAYRHRGGQHRAGVGALVLINPGEVHTGETDHENGWAYRGFYPSAEMIHALAADLSGDTHARPYFHDTVVLDPALGQRLDQLHRLLRGQADPLLRETMLASVFGDVLIRHMSLRPREQAAAPSAVERARQMLADDPATALSLQQLAQAVGLSPWQLCRQFKQLTGLPPVAWRNQLRVARARRLLASGLAPGAVALELGFADQPHLTRAFQLALGVTPAAYQKAMGAR